MSEITIETIAKTVEGIIKKELEPVNTKLDAIGETVSGHTGALFELSKDVKDIKAEMIVSNRRMDKHEEAIKFTAEKIGTAEPVKRILEV